MNNRRHVTTAAAILAMVMLANTIALPALADEVPVEVPPMEDQLPEELNVPVGDDSAVPGTIIDEGGAAAAITDGELAVVDAVNENAEQSGQADVPDITEAPASNDIPLDIIAEDVEATDVLSADPANILATVSDKQPVASAAEIQESVPAVEDAGIEQQEEIALQTDVPAATEEATAQTDLTETEPADSSEDLTVHEEDVELETYDAGTNPSSLMLGVFFSSENDQSDTLFVSFNGIDFYKLGYAYEDSNKNNSSKNSVVGAPSFVNCLHDPALQFAKGGYWSMSGFTTIIDGNRRFVPMISYSPDLVNWSYPNSGSATNVKPTVLPFDKNGNRNNIDFDCVAPELFFDDNGDAYIVVSMGYYATWHKDWNPQNDRMSSYLIKANGLTPGSYSPTDHSEKGKQPIVTYGDAIPINLPDSCNDRIDGHIYKEGGKYYLSIKRNGIINEIWSIDSLSNVSNKNAWTKVREIVTKGYEGPCLTKYSGQYYMYSDGLESFKPTPGRSGIYVSTSKTLSGDWSQNTPVVFYKNNKGEKIEQRHGSVITITDSTQISKIMALYYKQGYSAYNSSMSKAFTGSNPQSYHLVWSNEKGKSYWMENNKRQALPRDPKNIIDEKYKTERGREIYDPSSKAWYWLDSIYDGAKAVGKEVWMPYIYQDEKNWDDAFIRKVANESDPGMAGCVYDAMKNKLGKWVRYDENGAMLKGWVTIEGELANLYPSQKGNTYYYDHRTGLMAKGEVTIDRKKHFFDKNTGVMQY